MSDRPHTFKEATYHQRGCCTHRKHELPLLHHRIPRSPSALPQVQQGREGVPPGCGGYRAARHHSDPRSATHILILTALGYVSMPLSRKIPRPEDRPSTMRTSVARFGTAQSARRLARGRDHHCATTLAIACTFEGMKSLGVRTLPSNAGLAAFTVATVFCTATTGGAGVVDLKKSGRWATVESRECVSACVTAPSAANDVTTDCNGELGVVFKTGFRMKGVAGATGPTGFGFSVGEANRRSACEPGHVKGQLNLVGVGAPRDEGVVGSSSLG